MAQLTAFGRRQLLVGNGPQEMEMAKRFLEACATWLPGRGRNIPLVLAGDWLHLLQEGAGGSTGCPGVWWGGRVFRVGQCFVIHGDRPGPARAAGILSDPSSL